MPKILEDEQGFAGLIIAFFGFLMIFLLLLAHFGYFSLETFATDLKEAIMNFI